jgi:glycosyltransferase involved in cell wall biosynthesis
VSILANAYSPGAAGAWNTGLRYLRGLGYDGYVAILDDDDSWDPCHLLANLTVAQENGADIVVSGLRRVVAGQLAERSLPTNLTADDFLSGNPGLQGSNMFIAISALERAGDFTDGLPSLNDRDLALRLLCLQGLRISYTGEWTATWYHGDAPTSLSTPRSTAKIAGLQMFWRMHGSKMGPDIVVAYFDRALRFFGVSREEIMEGASE